MGFVFNGGQPDITFEADTPRGQDFLIGLQARALQQKLYEPPGTLGEKWNTLEQLLNARHNRPVPAWAIYGPPISRPLAPLAAKNMAQMTTLGLWQQMQKKQQQGG